MPTRPSKGVIAKYVELPSDLATEVEAFAKGRKESFKAVVEMALRRHMANPPPPPPPPALPPLAPLPPVTANEPERPLIGARHKAKKTITTLIGAKKVKK